MTSDYGFSFDVKHFTESFVVFKLLEGSGESLYIPRITIYEALNSEFRN